MSERRGLLACLFHSSEVIIRETTLLPTAESLHADETRLLSGCADKRRREIIASRLSARSALAELGVTGFALLPGPDRAPIWPPAIVGSITHTDGCADGYCGVAVARRGYAAGLGIDAEPRAALPDEIWGLVLDENERRDALRSTAPGVQARLVLSAKEATYKAVFPWIRRFLEFSDVHVDIFADGQFRASVRAPLDQLFASCNPLTGRFVMNDELMVTALVLPDPGLTLAQEALTLHHVPC